MTKILHIITDISGGGSARAMLAAAKYSSRLSNFEHFVFSLKPIRRENLKLVYNAGITLLKASEKENLISHINNADIVHLHFWNNPLLYQFLCSDLPPMRLLIWFHVTGELPQAITPALINFADFALAGSPYTYQNTVFENLSAEVKLNKTGMVNAGADFERLAGLQSKPHRNFNVGYIGNVSFGKAHPNYVPMSMSIDIPNIKFIICGSKGRNDFKKHGKQLGGIRRFDFRGYVENIKSVIEILDVYGYPISPHTSAGSELNLQEAMYGGIPPVVFPYANLKWIVEHEQTGLVVHSELEYKQAIEYLYHHPQERARLGRKAHDYAKTRFGAENTARELHAIYQRLLELPKRKRQWIPPEIIKLSANVKVQSGAECFLQALGDNIPQFFVSMRSQNLTEIMKAECQIAELPLTINNMVGGIPSYRNAYPQDPYLRLWNGLVMQHQGKHQEAIIEFLEAINLGLIHWRVYWYLAQSAIERGEKKIAESALSQVIEMEPEFISAVTLLNRLSTGEILMPSRVQLIIRKVKEKFL